MTTLSAPLDRIPADRVHRPGTPGFDAARSGFDLSAIPSPDLVVSAAGEDDVVDAVRLAVDHGFPVAVRATGHGPIPGVDRGLLVDTRAMSTVTVDPGRRTATIGAGTTWTSVLAACAPYGLAPLCGSAPDVGAVSYVLGGGLGVLGRRYGYAADRVRRIRLVTATGEPCEVTPDSDPELFWAVRGGGGNFGVATELEIDLVPVAALYGGGLFFPGEAAADLLAAFGRCTADAPDELSLSIAFITFPDLDAVPPPLRGRFVGHLRVAHLGAPAEAEALIAPLRAVATPFVDTVRTLPVAEIGTIHADPVRPQPVSCGGAVLPRWDDAAVDVLLSGVGATRPHTGGAAPGRRTRPTGRRTECRRPSRRPVQRLHLGLPRAVLRRGRHGPDRPVPAAAAVDRRTGAVQLLGPTGRSGHRCANGLRRGRLRPAPGRQGDVGPGEHVPVQRQHPACPAHEGAMTLQERMREMFTHMVEAKDASVVDAYYDPDFLLTTNGQTQDLAAFRAGHERVYPTAITYRVEYDEESWVESGDRLAARMWITTQRPGEEAHRIEVVLVAEYRAGRILRLHELTWPDWSQLSAFETY